ncbi:inositol phosphoceramide mannosyltransferase 3 isoform X2 [Eurytemora carolleeae]|uniref:inositol phosphoceramide mannosyltransferase 3 isoform X2 n=1 Tax=Eurytemora carolleeae TaxID=1294199 RepID=UPI000C790D70|nr:inositol phosphoceramide mannosyltransferase 3 isoform X2 [Eurytemora carolleeae]|eukprot:XP_023346972.1 inositol phosphoceramide mannosyltransferase 3-like isoform X2 [Eurytemora affinis]
MMKGRIMNFIWFGEMVSTKYQENILRCANLNPDYQVQLWTEIITEELKSNLSNVHLIDLNKEISEFQTYEWLLNETNKGYKSDILRYEIIYKSGGVYFDTDTICVEPLNDLLTASFVAFSPIPRSHLSNGVLGFPKGSKFLKYVLDALKLNIKKNPKGTSKTGPPFLTGCFKKYNDSNINMIFSLVKKTSKNVVYQTLDASWMVKKIVP